MGNCMDSNSDEENYTLQERPMPIQANQLSQKDIVIVKLKELRDELYQKQQALFRQEEKSEMEIRAFLVNNKKSRAKFALQRKKLYDNYLIQIEQKYNVINRQILQVETMVFDQNLNKVMASTNKFLKDIQNTINMDVFTDAINSNRALQEQEEQFEELFEKYNVKDVDKEYAKYEAEIFSNQINYQAVHSSQNQFQPIMQTIPTQQQAFVQQMPPVYQQPVQYIALS